MQVLTLSRNPFSIPALACLIFVGYFLHQATSQSIHEGRETGEKGSIIMNVITTTAPSRGLAWTVATVLAVAGIVGLALAPRVAAAIPKTAIQMVYAWLCCSLVGSAYVVVTLANDAEGANEDSKEF
ncbi:hypothetical protein [Luteibacter sp.]|uniref:hypothetical protein n=1 Tax=Luteibacter sp. TaxID=1886636 RepID=UPI003F7F00B3